jgi:hypothetical protein
MTRLDRLMSLGAAVVAAGVLLVAFPAAVPTPPQAPVPAAVAWPHAQTATVDSALPDGTSYQPEVFLDANTSVGIAPSPDQRAVRLLLHAPGTPARELRRLPADQNPSYGSFTSAGDIVAWAETTSGGHAQLWTVNVRDNRPARLLTADTGEAVLNGSPHDLVIANDRLYWTASDPQHRDLTEVRSVALTGGSVTIVTEPGTWDLSVWPWLVDGRGDTNGTTQLRDLLTNRVVKVPTAPRQTTHCDPTWCVQVSLSSEAVGGYDIDVVHPDGSGQLTVASGQVAAANFDVVALERFVVISQVTTTYTDLTGTNQLVVFDLSTRRTVVVSAAARTSAYSGGVLWWTTGTQDAPVWHALDLRTVQ